MSPETGFSPAPPEQSVPSHEELADLNVYSANRDAALQNLLGTDYEFAHTSGLINMFYYDPTTGSDGLMHVLGGEYIVGKDGARIPMGFHHEPSGEIAWDYNPAKGLENPETHRTYVDRSHLEGANKAVRREFVEAPFAPYHAHVRIDGLKKQTVGRGAHEGENTLVEVNNGMFPKEYDALAVMQTIRNALNNRDTTDDKIDLEDGLIITKGIAPMLDGVTPMNLRLVLDAESGKVKSAYPLVKRKPMQLLQEEIHHHLGLD